MIVEYLESIGHRFHNPQARNPQTICPFHAERSPSFTVYDDHATCYGCGWNGDFIRLIRDIEFVNLEEKASWRAAYLKAKELGFSITGDYSPPLPSRPRIPSSEQRRMMTVLFEYAHTEYLRSSQALGYLESRGVARPETMRVGYVPDGAKPFFALVELLTNAFGTNWVDLARDCGIVFKDGGNRLGGRVIIPEIRNGEVLYYVARAIIPKKARYLNPPDFAKPVLGLETLKRSYPFAVVVEGAFDALPLWALGIPTIALLGCKVTNPRALSESLRDKIVLVVLDNDESGEEGARNLIHEFQLKGVPAVRVTPRYKDIGQWAEEEGAANVVVELTIRANRERSLPNVVAAGQSVSPMLR